VLEDDRIKRMSIKFDFDFKVNEKMQLKTGLTIFIWSAARFINEFVFT